MHWADVAASQLAERGSKHIIAAGITPSGEFHIGHIREILTGEIISRACQHIGLDVDFIFIVDSADPLRKVYPFLHQDYEHYIGHQIGNIPPPDENGKPDVQLFETTGATYAQHFLEPFLSALQEIGVQPRIVDNLEMYRTGKFEPYAQKVCENKEIVREIIERVSGRELPEDWFPWTPLSSNGTLGNVKIIDYQHPIVTFEEDNGTCGTSDISKGEGKLPWRIDWPARWCFNEITMEPFGKDHGTAGGSYDTGKEIVKFFGYSAPNPLTYEWISLKGMGAMSSSVGNTIGPMEALRLVPPEILRLLVAKTKPSKAIEFDTGMGLVTLADEYERLASRNFEDELLQTDLSRRQKVQVEDAEASMRYAVVFQGEKAKSESVSFRHLAMLAQIRDSDEDVFDSLLQTGMISDVSSKLRDRLSRMRYWISSEHFPEEMQVRLQSKPTEHFFEHSNEVDINILRLMHEHFATIPWTSTDIHSVFGLIAETMNLKMKEVYRASYLLFLGAEKGPRLAPILEAWHRDSAIQLLKLAIE
jgi:lysyl-tRNA synthetase class 1